MIKFIAAASLSAAMAATAAFAQPAGAAAAPDDATGLSAVVVAADRLPTRRADVGSSITLITAEDIARKQETTLPDVLKDVPGLNVVQTGGPGGSTSVFLRGTNSNHVKVLVDGIDMSDPSTPTATFDFGQFATGDIARVEVLRGPQSGLYGSDAIGGVINVITREGQGPARFTAGLEGGSFDTFNQKAAVSGSTGAFHYAADLAHLRSGATPVTPLALLAPGEKRIDDSYDNITASTKLGYDVTRDFALGLVARYANTRLRFTGDDFFTGFPDVARSETDTRQYYTRASAHLSAFAGRFEQTLGLAYGSIATTGAGPENPTNYFTGDRFKADWQGAAKLTPGETLVMGAEHQRDGVRLPISASATTDSGYAELVSNPIPNLNASVAVRYDANSGFGDQTTWRLAPTYLIEMTGTKLQASVGTGFKAPTLSERFQDFPSFGFFGNPDLKPESSVGYDIGFEQALPMNDLPLQFGATWYHNTIRNLIDSNATFTSYANVGRAHTQGVESFIALRPIQALSLRLDYTYTEARDDILKEVLLRRPRDKWSLDARWQATRRLALDLDLLSVGSWIDGNRQFTVARLSATGYTTADLAANYEVTAQLTIYGRVANLADARYENPVGFQRPGRGVFAGIRATF
ncbi:MAG: TonB-dependent receptor plug domain-containing protein [Phenylobacterium sp.]